MARCLFLVVAVLALTALSGTTLAADERIKDRNILRSSIARRHPRVLVELFVMSRCPDARRAEARFHQVLQQVHSIVDMRTLYIADETDGSVVCKHGPQECEGNTQQLCAAHHGRRSASSAKGDPFQRGWAFLQCQNERFADVGSEQLADECLQRAGFSALRANATRACWEGTEGARLLRASAAETRRRGVAKSCTVYIDGKYRCTHDGAEWYDCPGGSEVADFVDTICSSYLRLSGAWPQDVCGPEPQASAPLP